MSEAPKGLAGGRRRKVEKDQSDDEEENPTLLQKDQQQTKTKVTRSKAPKATAATFNAVLPVHKDPMAANETTGVDPTNNNNNNNINNITTTTTMDANKTTSTANVNTTQMGMTAGGNEHVATAPSHFTSPATLADGSEDIFAIAYDTYTSEDLYALLKRYTRQEVEKRMVEHEQIRSSNQQQQMQVERFLDAAPTTAGRVGTSNNNNGNSNSAEELGGYMYSVMLQRLFVALNRNKESSAMTERNQLPTPQLERIGKKKVIITNFRRICQAFHRPIEDVKDYIEKELSVRGNLDTNDGLILKYETQKATAFDKIIIKYLDEYVKCNSCHKIDTTLTKEGRRMELRCNLCTATRTVQAVGSATFSAQVGKRSKARMQALTL
ncbi:translation initiation factor [Trypanosoma theileri]|uniref:Translation initiation factor n=1 Tax=Trypanosoma theileri TaxID=67003 RepID=A0A1X0NPQ0_9TRYP|nr:translation initiation factor [Trypanosoma theileri]ORC86463.1 translation initiation factor [Trypanosoma theileri]